MSLYKLRDNASHQKILISNFVLLHLPHIFADAVDILAEKAEFLKEETERALKEDVLVTNTLTHCLPNRFAIGEAFIAHLH